MSRFEPIRKPTHYLVYLLILSCIFGLSALLFRLL
jgi:hypothetical protein